MIYEPPSAARLASYEASMPGLFEAQGVRLLEVRTVAFARSRAICFAVA